jgi:hypothetical protein
MKSLEGRNPLDKPTTMFDSLRARWVGVGLIMTIIVLLCNIYAKIDPAPYLQTITVLIGAGILGWSVDSAAKIFKVESSHQTVTETQVTTKSNDENKTVTVSVDSKNQETVNENVNINENIKIEYPEHLINQEDPNAPEIRPYSETGTIEE